MARLQEGPTPFDPVLTTVWISSMEIIVKADKDIGSVTLLIAEIWEKKIWHWLNKILYPYKKILRSH